MMTNCHDHNKTCRVEVNYYWRIYNENLNKKVVLDLACRCRVYEQLKEKFFELSKLIAYPSTDIEFTCMTHEGLTTVVSGYEIYNNIRPEMSFYHTQLSQLVLNVRIIEVSAIVKLAELEHAVKECKTTIKADKNWRMIKDTEIAEEQLSLREFFEKQQKEIKDLQNGMADMKTQIERRRKEEETRFTRQEVHEASCDQCEDLIIGHRFKCAVCPNYDLCQGCEAIGAHPQHAMIRLVSPEHTFVPEYLIQQGKKIMREQETQANCVNACKVFSMKDLESKIPTSKTCVKKAKAPKILKPGVAPRFRDWPVNNCRLETHKPIRYTTQFPKRYRNTDLTCPKMSYMGSAPDQSNQSYYPEKYLPEITINPPMDQTSPFHESDFLVQLVSSPRKTQPIVQNRKDIDLYQRLFGTEKTSTMQETTSNEAPKLKRFNEEEENYRKEALKKIEALSIYDKEVIKPETSKAASKSSNKKNPVTETNEDSYDAKERFLLAWKKNNVGYYAIDPALAENARLRKEKKDEEKKKFEQEERDFLNLKSQLMDDDLSDFEDETEYMNMMIEQELKQENAANSVGKDNNKGDSDDKESTSSESSNDSISTSISFDTLAEILRDIEEYECSSESDDESIEDFDVDKYMAECGGNAPTPESKD